MVTKMRDRQLFTERQMGVRQQVIIEELRTENKQLRQLRESDLEAAARVITDLRAENERLKAELVEADRKVREYRPNVDAALQENERLRAALDAVRRSHASVHMSPKPNCGVCHALLREELGREKRAYV